MSLKIGDVARLSGLPTKTIRYYESVGLLPAPQRADNGYRIYADDAVHGQDLHAHQRLCVFLRVDVVGDHADGILLLQPFSEPCRQRGFARAHGAADTDAEGAIHLGHV